VAASRIIELGVVHAVCGPQVGDPWCKAPPERSLLLTPSSHAGISFYIFVQTLLSVYSELNSMHTPRMGVQPAPHGSHATLQYVFRGPLSHF